MHAFPALFEAWKTIALAPRWSAPHSETGYSWFDAALEIDGVVIRGLVLHGGCYPSKPGCHVTFELRIAKVVGRPARPLARIDWRSLTGGHSNQRRWGTEWAGKTVGPSHFHDFWLNYSQETGRLKSANLPVASPLDPEPDSFFALRDFTRQALKIANMERVEEPGWERKLL